MTNWYYAEAGNQIGPVDEPTFNQLVTEGKIRPETLVWHEGMANWQPFGSLGNNPAAAGTDSTAGSRGLTCCECGRAFADEEMIHYGAVRVCAGCKPLFFQRLKEGGGVGHREPSLPSEEQIRARDYEVQFGQYLSRGWGHAQRHLGQNVLATLLVGLCLGAVQMVPYCGGCIQIFLQGPLVGGWIYFMLLNSRNRGPSLSDAFTGFGSPFLPLMYYQLVQGILTLLCFLPGLAMLIAVLAMGGDKVDDPIAFFKISPALCLLSIPALLLGWFVSLYLDACWIFSPLLILERRMFFWDAMTLSRHMVNKHWLMMILLVFVARLIQGVGFLACCVGALVSSPIYGSTIVSAYEHIINGRDQSGPV